MMKEADSALLNWSDWESCTALVALFLTKESRVCSVQTQTHETKLAQGSLQCKTPVRTCVKEHKNHLKRRKIPFVKCVNTLGPVIHKAWPKSKQIHSLTALLKRTLLQCYLCRSPTLIPHSALRDRGWGCWVRINPPSQCTTFRSCCLELEMGFWSILINYYQLSAFKLLCLPC